MGEVSDRDWRDRTISLFSPDKLLHKLSRPHPFLPLLSGHDGSQFSLAAKIVRPFPSLSGRAPLVFDPSHLRPKCRFLGLAAALPHGTLCVCPHRRPGLRRLSHCDLPPIEALPVSYEGLFFGAPPRPPFV